MSEFNCPHCFIPMKFKWESTSPFNKSYIEDVSLHYANELQYASCPSCHEVVVLMNGGFITDFDDERGEGISFEHQRQLYPQHIDSKLSEYVPNSLIEDFEESLKVLKASPKSSAAISRRLLQQILHDHYNIKERNLSIEIDKFIELDNTPSYISDAIDAIRVIGNFAAHPVKYKNTGEIVEVNEGEAEWSIEVIKSLFDFTFVQPKLLEKRRNELNLKLEKTNKPSLKKGE